MKIVVAALFLIAAHAVQGLDIGEPAPNFIATDTHGRKHNLSDYQGQYVVLEWSNRQCSYVQNLYKAGVVQKLQQYWTGKDVVWLTVISSAPGLQGYVTAQEENQYLHHVGAKPSAVLLDPTGELGHLYEATTTPDIFVISPGGKLIYQGAFDDRPKVGYDGIPGDVNYVERALEQSMAGKKVTTPETRAYGYTIKYAQ